MVAAALTVTVAAPFAVAGGLAAVGFGAAGVGAGTIAAGLQAGIGNVVAGSLFAGLTFYYKTFFYRSCKTNQFVHQFLLIYFNRCPKCRSSWSCYWNGCRCRCNRWSSLGFNRIWSSGLRSLNVDEYISSTRYCGSDCLLL